LIPSTSGSEGPEHGATLATPVPVTILSALAGAAAAKLNITPDITAIDLMILTSEWLDTFSFGSNKANNLL
jgi:hypothetical protein